MNARSSSSVLGLAPAASAPIDEKRFSREYAQHIDIRGRRSGLALANRQAILRDGFRKGFNVNALPPSRGLPYTTIIEAGFAPLLGDVVYLAPRGAWRSRPNGMEVQDGWRPQPWEAVVIGQEDVGRPMYEVMVRAWNRHHRQVCGEPQAPTAVAAVSPPEADVDSLESGSAPRPRMRP